ncbi:PREDICTED: protein SULFUR DEFICIENCY-INDUCED 2-like [Camelina sativa]|uniref:Protein SULFUR DEFICIENCY-INDUCED 2-like n=1 Tax=Camelina sativa TaxID=90675 RepID=A0ABM0XD87_CAMSA|nr:PREDICTED: protein SULFUR DEFICIENCY-INDUCED 2-like [Camelina sativa]
MMMTMVQRRGGVDSSAAYNVVHKLPHGDSPYVRAKHVQLVEKDAEAAIKLFWRAIKARDRVDSALKDMALLMKQQNRAEEAIEAIHSFRDLCSRQAQESLDNVLIDLFKKCGRIEEQVELLKQKLWMIYQGEAFNGKPTKTARSHGKKFQVTVEKETSRILGNLGWAYMQLRDYTAAETVYRKAQVIEPDANKACNLCTCLIKQGKYDEARSILSLHVLTENKDGFGDPRLKARVQEILSELDPQEKEAPVLASVSVECDVGMDEIAVVEGFDDFVKEWRRPYRTRRLPIFEEILPLRDQLAC